MCSIDGLRIYGDRVIAVNELSHASKLPGAPYACQPSGQCPLESEVAAARQCSRSAVLYLLVRPQSTRDFDVDAIRDARLYFTLLELLRSRLHFHERLLALDDKVAFVDGERVLALVEHDVGVRAVVGPQEQLLVERHRGADRELDSALISDSLRCDVFELGLEGFALERTDIEDELHAFAQLPDLGLV